MTTTFLSRTHDHVEPISGWRLHKLDDKRPCPLTDIGVDRDWLEAAAGGREHLHILTDHEGKSLMGVASFRSVNTHIRVAAGPLPLYSARIQRFYPLQQLRTTRTEPLQALTACLTTLAATLPSRSAVYFDGAPIGSDLERILAAPPVELLKCYFVLPWGSPFEHCKIKWAGTVEAYLKSLTSKNRWNMKRPVQKAKEAGATFDLRRFESPADVDDFLDDGTRISDQTYQKQRLRSGLVRGGDREASMRFAAARGGFLAHVLYAGDKPIAFQYALIHDKTLYGLEMGYDPAFSDLQIGSILFFKMLEDLENHGDAINLIDLMTYDNLFKHRSSNLRIAARNYYLFPRTAVGRMTYVPVLIATYVRKFAMWTLRALKLTDRIKHWSRFRQRRPKS